MRIATFNANSIRMRLGVILRWLEANRPDVFCVQETKVIDEQFPLRDIEAAGYHAIFRGEKSYNGVALLSLQAPRETWFGLDDGGQADATRLVAARVGPVWVVNTYVPQGREIDHPMYRYKIEWLRRLRACFERHFKPSARLVWVGDLNVAPGEADIYNAAEQTDHVCYHADVRKAFAEVMDWGFVDVFRKHHPEPGQYTFFDFRTPNAVKRGMGWRVDHILATRPLAATSRDCRIDLQPRLGEKPSDHTMLLADFDL